MIYPIVAAALGLIAFAIVLFGARVLLNRSWFLGWLRGTFGISVVVLAIVLMLAAWDLRSYEQVLAQQPVATLTFNKLQPQHYGVTLVYPNNRERRVELNGDLWQLDARVLGWTPRLAAIGIKPGYRVDRLSGRYLALEDEQSKPRSVVELDTAESVFDTWYWLRRVHQRFTILDAGYARAAYLPMADGAVFAVNLGPSGLSARPLNDRAKLASERWQ